jgi:hypothetical protein
VADSWRRSVRFGKDGGVQGKVWDPLGNAVEDLGKVEEAMWKVVEAIVKVCRLW